MPIAAEHSIADILQAHAQRSPDKPAILAPGRASLSYGALWNRAETFGAVLSAHGIENGDRVALALRNGPDAAAAFKREGAGPIRSKLPKR